MCQLTERGLPMSKYYGNMLEVHLGIALGLERFDRVLYPMNINQRSTSVKFLQT